MGAYSRLGDYHLLGYQGERLLEVGRLFEVRRLSTFSVIRVCAYLRLSDYQPSWPTGWALTRVWAIINLLGHQGGAYSTLGAYQPPWPSGGGDASSRMGAYQPSWPSGWPWALTRGGALI